MDCVTRLIRYGLRHFPRLRRTRKWWFRPLWEGLTLAIQVLSFAPLMQSDFVRVSTLNHGCEDP